MENLDWQLIAVLICVAVAMWSIIARLRNLIAGKGGCGDCSKAKPSAAEPNEPKLISEDQIALLYESKK
ncbi:MAG: hypothetical protein ISQ06_05610 [Planctomycetaceae bacterium]|jgi:hypothetical protein|nr:hypothetical protein [Planctomycetaceae bacterium]